MTGASLKGLSEDGTHVLVITDDGVEVRIAITDELRALLRHARVVRKEESPATSTLSPREIQQRIRAGLNAAELAHLTGEPVEALAKFEAPVLAERAYMVQCARGTAVGRAHGAPQLDELVDDRLLARGVDPSTATWDAWREVDEPWRVSVDFVVDGRTIRAVWTYDHHAKTLTAEDDESAWLTETELLQAPSARRHLAAVRHESTPLVPVASTTTSDATQFEDDDLEDTVIASSDHELTPTEALLEDLHSRRGLRESIDMEEDEPAASASVNEGHERFEGFGPARSLRRGSQQAPSAKSGGSSAANPPQSAGAQNSPVSPAGGQDKRSRKGRASVPSWDEIVFGTKND